MWSLEPEICTLSGKAARRLPIHMNWLGVEGRNLCGGGPSSAQKSGIPVAAFAYVVWRDPGWAFPVGAPVHKRDSIARSGGVQRRGRRDSDAAAVAFHRVCLYFSANHLPRGIWSVRRICVGVQRESVFVRPQYPVCVAAGDGRHHVRVYYFPPLDDAVFRECTEL